MPSVEDDGASGESPKKSSQKKVLPRSNWKMGPNSEPPSKRTCPRSKQMLSGHGQAKGLVPLGKDDCCSEGPKKSELSHQQKKVSHLMVIFGSAILACWWGTRAIFKRLFITMKKQLHDVS